MIKLITSLAVGAAMFTAAFAQNSPWPYPGAGPYAFQSEDTDCYISAEGGSRATANRTVITDDEKFTTEIISGNTLLIKSVATGKYLRRLGGGRVKADADHSTTNTAIQWKIERVYYNNTRVTLDGWVIRNVGADFTLQEVGTGAGDLIRAKKDKTSRSYRWSVVVAR